MTSENDIDYDDGNAFKFVDNERGIPVDDWNINRNH